EDRYEDWISLHIRREAQWAAITEMVLEEGECDLTAVIFDGVDKLQHLCWRFLDPAVEAATDARFGARVQALCREYFTALDRHIARLVEVAADTTEILICSDHG